MTLFESKIPPVLAGKCYGGHSAKPKAPMGGLVLDKKEGMAAGGANGPVITAGKPLQSRLIAAIRFNDPHLQMPPMGKLPDGVIADFEAWVKAGAPDPRAASVFGEKSAALKGMSLEEGKKWWAFQPIGEVPVPQVSQSAWVRNKIDAPSAAADRRTLVRRAYMDLIGYKPSYQEVEAFVAETSADAWGQLIDKLQSMPK